MKVGRVTDADGFTSGLDLYGVVAFPGSSRVTTARLRIQSDYIPILELVADLPSPDYVAFLTAIQTKSKIPQLSFYDADGPITLVGLSPTSVNMSFGTSSTVDIGTAKFRIEKLVKGLHGDLTEMLISSVSIRVPELSAFMWPSSDIQSEDGKSLTFAPKQIVHSWIHNGGAFSVCLEGHFEIAGSSGTVQNWVTLEVSSDVPCRIEVLIGRLIETLMFFQILCNVQFHFDNVRATPSSSEPDHSVDLKLYIAGYDSYQAAGPDSFARLISQPLGLITSQHLENWSKLFSDWQKAIYPLNALATRVNVTAEERTLNSFIAIEHAALLLGKQHEQDEGPNRSGWLSAKTCAERSLRHGFPNGAPLGSNYSDLAKRMATNENDIKHPRLAAFPPSEETFVLGCIAQAAVKSNLFRQVLAEKYDQVVLPEIEWATGAAQAFGMIFP